MPISELQQSEHRLAQARARLEEALAAKKPLSTHRVDLTGDYETTVYDVARRLLAEGADPGDRVELGAARFCR